MFKNIWDSLRRLYLKNKRPWLVGFSGGKVNDCCYDPHDTTGSLNFVTSRPATFQ
ncbi:MAG: hypothetical protein WC740_10560 [Verrucomicrobiia bacterium]